MIADKTVISMNDTKMKIFLLIVLLKPSFLDINKLSFILFQVRFMISQVAVSADAQQFCNSHVGPINQLFGSGNTAYKVISESVQHLNGVLHYLHIVGLQDNLPYTITVLVPINGLPSVVEFARGHLPHVQGYSKTVIINNNNFHPPPPPPHHHDEHHGHHGHHGHHHGHHGHHGHHNEHHH